MLNPEKSGACSVLWPGYNDFYDCEAATKIANRKILMERIGSHEKLFLN